jgi:methanol:N,N-dimethyl-4-nitrosoaniline oxidoreductase
MDYTKSCGITGSGVFSDQPTSLMGSGAHEMAGPEAQNTGLRHVLIVTTGLRGTGILDEVRRNLEDSGVTVSVYDKVESNPKDYNAMDAYQMDVDDQCDGFVSLGGGSATDCTKGARVVAAHDGRNLNEFQGLFKSENLDNPPHIAINTTVGTGSETSPLRGHHRHDLREGAAQVGPRQTRAMTTTLAINDPVLCMTQPCEFISYTGFDTIAHASEAYAGRVQHSPGRPWASKPSR